MALEAALQGHLLQAELERGMVFPEQLVHHQLADGGLMVEMPAPQVRQVEVAVAQEELVEIHPPEE